MIKTLSQAISEAFEAGIREAAPEFELYLSRSTRLRKGDRVYRRVSGGLSTFIVLTLSQSGTEAFTVEVGWSANDRFPEVRRGFFGPTPERHEFDQDEFIFRLPELALGKDQWFRIRDSLDVDDAISKEQARKLVVPLVRDALAMVRRNALPYLQELSTAKSRMTT